MTPWDECAIGPAEGFPPGWAWRTYPEDLWQELVDDTGTVVATVDWGTTPTEYSVMGETRVLAPEGWHMQPGGNVAVTGAPDVRAAIARELGVAPETRRERVVEVAREAAAASRSVRATPAAPPRDTALDARGR